MRRPKSIDIYVALVSLAGIAVGAVFAWHGRHAAFGESAGLFWLFTVIILLGELLPIRTRRG
ncbi:MAG: hypothetical protein ACRDJ5_10970, partial [Actinomycetota bacterium]